MDIVVIMQCQSKLFQIVTALHSSSGLSCGLDGGEEQGDEHAYDGDDDEEFDEREGSRVADFVCAVPPDDIVVGSLESPTLEILYFAPPQVNILFDIATSFEYEVSVL